jgi:gallate decarboxylase subunit C
LPEIYDLRSAIHALALEGHSIVEDTAPLDPRCDLIEKYIHSYQSRGSFWMCAEQPLRRYKNPIRGVFPVVLGLFGSRDRVRFFLDPSGRHGSRTSNADIIVAAIATPLAPVKLKSPSPRTVEMKPDLTAMLPALTCTPGDPGPTITMGLVYARDEQTGRANCSVHRITLKKSSAVIGINPKGHLQRMIDDHAARGQRLPVSVNIGLDPAIYIAAALSRPAVGYGDDELGVAGGIRRSAVQIAPCFSHTGFFIDHAEIVLEGSLGTEKELEHETDTAPRGDEHTMPEYLGYFSRAGEVSVLQTNVLTFRSNAIYQAVTGPGREQSELLGAGQETSILRMVKEWGGSGLFKQAIATPSGGGHLLTVLQIAKRSCVDDDRARELAQHVLRTVPTSKSIILVDEDVDPLSSDDLLWALSTRFRAEMDLAITPELPGVPLDPTQSSLYKKGSTDGFTNKSVLDCSTPFALRARFRKAFSTTYAGSTFLEPARKSES